MESTQVIISKILYLLENGRINTSEVYFSMLGSNTITNTTQEGSMINNVGIGDLVVYANSLHPGDILRLDFAHRLTSGNAQRSTVKIKFGDVTLVEHSAVLPNNLTSNKFSGYIDILILTVGVNGTCKIVGQSNVVQNNNAILVRDLDNIASIPINTTIDNLVDFRYKWDTASTSNIIVSHEAVLRKL